jgi:hypothetical protein
MQKKIIIGWLPNHFEKIELMQIGVKLHSEGKTIFSADQRLKFKKPHELPNLFK